MKRQMELNQVVERRRGRDRRKKRLSDLLAPFTHRRRARVRRLSDRRTIVQLDLYSKPVLPAIVLVCVLSMVDAYMTLFLIGHGAVEMNPVMDYFLRQGLLTFVLVKYMLTAMSVILVVALHYVYIPFMRIFVSDLIMVFAGVFAAVVSWQIYLTMRYVW
jgi:hypothetical protein